MKPTTTVRHFHFSFPCDLAQIVHLGRAEYGDAFNTKMILTSHDKFTNLMDFF